MNWNSAAEFFEMGGYGLYVWGSYGVMAAWMLLEPMLAGRRFSAARAAAMEFEANGEQV